jgi:Lipopolysaccharide kinase (Kdo/WaaP) family
VSAEALDALATAARRSTAPQPPLGELQRREGFALRRWVRVAPELAHAWERAWGPGWWLDPLRCVERTPLATRIAQRRNRSLYLVDDAPTRGASLYFKHQRYPLPARLFTWVFVPWGRRELEALRTAGALGVPAVTPLLGGVVERGPFVHESWLATRAVSGALNLSAWQKNRTGDSHAAFSPEEVRAALPALWRMLGRLHRHRFYCRTTGAKNVLVYRAADGAIAFALHDLPRALHRPWRGLSLRLAAQDLARLERWAVRWLDDAERDALLDHYLRELGEGPARGVWQRRVARALDRQLRRTPVSRLPHRVRRTLKDLPGLGHWFR